MSNTETIKYDIAIFSWIMLTKVYVAQNAFEQAIVILNLFYLQMRKKNSCLSESEFEFFSRCK